MRKSLSSDIDTGYVALLLLLELNTGILKYGIFIVTKGVSSYPTNTLESITDVINMAKEPFLKDGYSAIDVRGVIGLLKANIIWKDPAPDYINENIYQ